MLVSRAFEELQLREHVATEFSLGQHALNGQLQNVFWLVREAFNSRVDSATTGKAGVVLVRLL